MKTISRKDQMILGSSALLVALAAIASFISIIQTTLR